MSEAKFAALMERLSQEFRESCRDKLEAATRVLERAHDGTAVEADTLEFRRDIHTIKGQGGTFGFAAISLIAHKLEDYLESSDNIHPGDVPNVQRYLDVMGSIVDAGENPSPEATEKILRALPAHAPRPGTAAISKQATRRINVLLVMPRGLWRRLVSHELASCGFNLSYAETGLDAIRIALAMPPDIIVSTMELPDLTGVDLAKVVRALPTTARARFAILTSHDETDVRAKAPKETAIIGKNRNFTDQLVAALTAWKIF